MKRNKRLTLVAALMAATLLVAGCGKDVQQAPPKEETTKPPTVEEQQAPQKDDKNSEKAQKYQATLNSFSEGNSYNVYYDFVALGDYKDSAKLAHDALIQNKLNFFGGEPAEWFKARTEEWTPIPLNQVADTLGGRTWLVPNVHCVGYTEYHYRSDGSGEILDPVLGQTFREFSWSVGDKRLELEDYNAPDDQAATAPSYQEEYYKIADGVIICFGQEMDKQDHPWVPMLYINQSSDFGKRYLKASATIRGLNETHSGKWRIVTDPKGLYYAEVEG